MCRIYRIMCRIYNSFWLWSRVCSSGLHSSRAMQCYVCGSPVRGKGIGYCPRCVRPAEPDPPIGRCQICGSALRGKGQDYCPLRSRGCGGGRLVFQDGQDREPAPAPKAVAKATTQAATRASANDWVRRGPGINRMGIGGSQTIYRYSRSLGATLPDVM